MNPLDFTPNDFNAYLAEMYPDGGGNAAFLRQQYREKNNFTNMLPNGGLPDGRQAVAGGFASKDAGATGRDAMRSLRPAIWNGIMGLLQGGGEAVQAPLDAYQGLLSRDEMTDAAMGTASMAMGSGLLAESPKGALRSGLLRDEPTLPAPRNDAEAMAKKVLEMRAAGKAGDVTDDMMAMADDPYMFNNTPLDMDAMNRHYRASKLGHDIEPIGGPPNDRTVYHQTPADIDAFSLGMQGEGPAQGHSGGGAIWASTSPDNIPAAHNTRDDMGFVEGTNTMPIVARKDKRVGTEQKWDESYGINDNFPQRVTMAENERLRGEGFTHGSVGREIAILNPANIRSRYARFDPAFKHLRNLSAGVAGVGLLSQADQRQQRRGLLE